jgi:hypothetical protein
MTYQKKCKNCNHIEFFSIREIKEAIAEGDEISKNCSVCNTTLTLHLSEKQERAIIDF